MKIPSPFKLVTLNHLPENSVAFEASFPLPHDDTPDSKNELVVQIILEDMTSEYCEINLINRTNLKGHIIGSFSARVYSLANVLYSFARIKMIPKLELS